VLLSAFFLRQSTSTQPQTEPKYLLYDPIHGRVRNLEMGRQLLQFVRVLD
jgi:hypothetical protein